MKDKHKSDKRSPLIMKLPVVRYSPVGAVLDTWKKDHTKISVSSHWTSAYEKHIYIHPKSLDYSNVLSSDLEHQNEKKRDSACVSWSVLKTTDLLGFSKGKMIPQAAVLSD